MVWAWTRPAQSIMPRTAILRRISESARRRSGSRLSASGHPELRCSPQVFVGKSFWWQQSSGEILLDAGPAEQGRPESSGTQEPASEDGGTPYDASRNGHPAEQRPRNPETAQGHQSNQQIPVAVGRANQGTHRHTAAGVGLAHGMRHRQVPADHSNHHQQGENGDGKGEQKDARHAENQPYDEHAEGGEQQDLA